MSVEGRIQTGKYDKEGRTIYTTEVVVDDVRFLDPRPAHEMAGGGGNAVPPATNRGAEDDFALPDDTGDQHSRGRREGGGAAQNPNSFPPAGEKGTLDITDDDLPF